MITDNDDLEVRFRSTHDCGRMPGQWFYSHYIYGSNYRLSEWQGAILTQQLSPLDEQQAVRQENAAILDRLLPEIEGIRPQALDPRVTCNGRYCYIFHYEPEAFAGLSTERFIQALNAEGIPTQASYPPVHRLDVFQNNEFRKRLAPERSADVPCGDCHRVPRSPSDPGHDDEPDLVESPLSQRVTRHGVTVQVDIYCDSDGRWILEIVDAENASHVWDERFETDREALDEALRALDEEPLEFLGRTGEQPLN